MASQKITTNFWFDRQAGEAAEFYCSVFKNSRIIKTSYYGKEGFEAHRMPEGTVMTIEFELDGQKFVGLNGGPVFQFNESVSFIIDCENQQEVDYFWNKLTRNGGKESACGWLKDKFGVSWQVTPRKLIELITSADKEKAGRAMNAMLKMKKIDIDTIQRAYDGK